MSWFDEREVLKGGWGLVLTPWAESLWHQGTQNTKGTNKSPCVYNIEWPQTSMHGFIRWFVVDYFITLKAMNGGSTWSNLFWKMNLLFSILTLNWLNKAWMQENSLENYWSFSGMTGW